MEIQIKKAQEEFGVKIVAVCTDSAAVEVAMRKELVKSSEFSHLGSFPCMAHQVSFFHSTFFAKYSLLLHRHSWFAMT